MKRQQQRLAFSYLVVIMVLSLLFSIIIYSVSSSQLNRPLPPSSRNIYEQTESPPKDIQIRLEQRDQETRQQIILALVFLNIVVLGLGTWLSYLLAGKTLKPINAAVEQQTRFVTDASHELRTPLTALQISNEVALRKKVLTENKARSVLESNISEIEKLRDLSNALLELTQTKQVVQKKQSIQLHSLIHEVISNFSDTTLKQSITIKNASEERLVDTHMSALKQLLTILIDNAVKYSPPGSTIIISSTHQNNRTTISVEDRGIGIAKDDLIHIFDRFYRAESARTRTELSGYGLGLAIAKNIAEYNDYILEVESEIEKGTTFKITI